MEGMLARSKAGHDKDTVYIILREDDAYVYLADGRIRTVDRPKKKNKKHVQRIEKFRAQTPQTVWSDLAVRGIIKAYLQEAGEDAPGN